MILAGNWYDLTNPAGARFRALWAPYFMYVIIGNLAIVAANIFLAVMFFQRRRRFPTLFIWLLGFEAAIVIANAVFNRMLSVPTDQSLDPRVSFPCNPAGRCRGRHLDSLHAHIQPGQEHICALIVTPGTSEEALLT